MERWADFALGPLCQSISRLKNLLNWCWRPAKTGFLSVSKLIKWMWWVVKYKSERPWKTEIEGFSKYDPELTLRSFGPKDRFWKTLEDYWNIWKTKKTSSLLVHASRFALSRCSVSRRGLFQKCCHRCHWETNELTGKSKFRRWDNTAHLIASSHPPWTRLWLNLFFISGCVRCS